MPVLGLHHVTATVDDAQADLDFCAGGLGLRLVKKTVNFDNRFVYHFYYGDERGTPGTVWTTFPYKGHGVKPGAAGAGQIAVTSFSVPTGALEFWRERLATGGVPVTDVEPRFGERAVRFSDPSGLTFELIASDRDRRTPWVADRIEPETAIRGLHSVTLVVRDAAGTLELLQSLLGWTASERGDRRVRMTAGGGGPGRIVDVVEDPDAGTGANGLGTVHHVAMAVATEAEQLQIREELLRQGRTVTEVRDRCYFKSIYFREPGGVLFEVATIGPGFTVDEETRNLGRDLKLPPWEEMHRPAIEAKLPPVRYRR